MLYAIATSTELTFAKTAERAQSVVAMLDPAVEVAVVGCTFLSSTGENTFRHLMIDVVSAFEHNFVAKGVCKAAFKQIFYSADGKHARDSVYLYGYPGAVITHLETVQENGNV